MPIMGELSQYAAISPKDIATEIKKLIDSTERADHTINIAVEEKRNELVRKINESKK